MEKLGVDVEEAAKVAADKQKPKCPQCGRDLISLELVNVPKCPRCGTKPFEKA